MAVRSAAPTEEQLNQFVSVQDHSVYLQSWQWGEFQKMQGKKIVRQLWHEGEQPVAALTLIHQPLPIIGGYGYVPKGPVALGNHAHDSALWQTIANWISDYQRQHGLLFTQIEPPTADHMLAKTLLGTRWRQAPGIQPRHTQLIDLTLSEEKLLGAMHHKTRYNIGLAQRKGVAIQWHNTEALDVFWELVQETNARDQITSFGKRYYSDMLGAFGEHARLATATYDGKPLAMNLVISFGDTVTYAHGGSTNELRNVMAPQLLQWETIRWAKAAGFRYYDFRGIAPNDDPAHSWAGITRFKKGFGGQSVGHIGAFDLVNKPAWYWLYRKYRRGSVK